ncbi:MAG: YqgE/AlgH family protein [Bacteroidota bacterium]
MDLFNTNKTTHLLPAAGRLLIAEPFLGDDNFSRAVILLCEHNEEGSVGFVLNRPTQLILGDILENISQPSLPLYQGGPVQMDTLHMLHRMQPSLGGVQILPGIFWGGSYNALQDVLAEDMFDAAHLKLFIGYSGWSSGQLMQEIKEGSWLVADAHPELLFDTHVEEIWKLAVRSLGNDFTFLSNMPIDPQLN